MTLTAFDPRRGEGRVKIAELKAERGRFYETMEYGEAGQTRVDYKTYDLKKASEFPFHTNRNDAIKEIKNRPGSRRLIRLRCAQENFSFSSRFELVLLINPQPVRLAFPRIPSHNSSSFSAVNHQNFTICRNLGREFRILGYSDFRFSGFVGHNLLDLQSPEFRVLSTPTTLALRNEHRPN